MMSPVQVTRPAPPFRSMALVGRDFQSVALDDYRGRWLLLLFYPLDFTFVCPTELTGLNARSEDFAQRGCALLGASTDSVYSHLGWVKAEPRLADLKFPLLADYTKEVAKSYGVLLEQEGVALRASFLIDPQGIVRHLSVNDLEVGRSIDELLRTLDALQSKRPCPCNWQPGEPTL